MKMPKLLSQTARRINDLAKEQLDRVKSLLTRKANPTNDEMHEILSTFDENYADVLRDAVSDVVDTNITLKDMLRYPVGEVTLSKRLYQQAQETSAQVRRIMKDWESYRGDSRKLAMELFEGYGFRDREVLNPTVRLPRYMNDAILNGKTDALMERIRKSQLRTDALRAGYLEALNKIHKGAGQAAIDKALDVAVQERYRYFANRIAQTELSRMHNRRLSKEYMDDENIEVVQFVLSHTHPRPDICDLFARTDNYGIGAGCYPKDACPMPPIHPYCRCFTRPRLDLKLRNARKRDAASREWLRSLGTYEATQIAGSKANREAMIAGANVDNILNAGRPDAYHFRRVGDPPDENLLD